MDSNTPITSKKYKTIGNLLQASVNSINLVANYEKNEDVRNYLFEWLYINHYSKKPMTGNLTSRIHNICNSACYHYIMKNAFNNMDIQQYQTTKYILTSECTDFIQKIHSIQSSLSGIFLDYLVRRIISEETAQQFSDSRADGLYLNEYFNQFPSNCYDISIDTLHYKTCGILPEIFITSLSHTFAFCGIPNQEKVDSILHLLKNTPNIIEIFVVPIQELCQGLLNNDKNNILLNPCLGYKIPILDNKSIPSDCDLIINDILYDIKCTCGDKTIYEILQLLGYASLINCNTERYKRKINTISILNLLQGRMISYDISHITTEQMISYLNLVL
jgi:hypothetical protein